MSVVTINGRTYTGSSISICNGKVIVNGVNVTPDEKEINIAVSGNVDQLSVDACSKVTVTGDVGSVKSQSGDVDVSGNVLGSVQTMSGDVDCGNISGSVSTMSGDVKYKRS